MEPDKEITAMTEIARALRPFGRGENDVVKRIVQWVVARYGAPPADHADTPTPSVSANRDELSEDRFEHLPDLFEAAAPQTNSERVLVVSYWVTEEDNHDFTAQDVNSRLKDLGYGVKHITRAFDALINQTPALVIQTAKKGTSRQARKRYRLTQAGHVEVKRMIHRVSETDN